MPERLIRKERLVPYWGLFLAIVSCLMAGSGSLVIKVRPEIDPIIINLLLFSLMTCTSLSVCVNRSYPIKCEREEWPWLAQRFVVAAIANFSVVAALQYVSASDMTAIVFCSPVFMSLISPIFTPERFRFRNILLALIAVAGVFFICRPSFLFGSKGAEPHPNRLLGVIWSIVGCVFQTYLSLVASKMARTPIHVSMFVVGLVLAIVLTLVVILSFGGIRWPACGFDSFVAFLAAFLILSSITLENFSIRHEKLTTLSISLTAQLIFIMVLEVYFFGEILFWTDMLGAVLILTSIFTLFALKVREDAESARSKTMSVPADKDTVSFYANGTKEYALLETSL